MNKYQHTANVSIASSGFRLSSTKHFCEFSIRRHELDTSLYFLSLDYRVSISSEEKNPVQMGYSLNIQHAVTHHALVNVFIRPKINDFQEYPLIINAAREQQ